jgi:hypothetical protein
MTLTLGRGESSGRADAPARTVCSGSREIRETMAKYSSPEESDQRRGVLQVPVASAGGAPSTSLGLSCHGARYPERCMRLGARAAPALGVKNERDDRVGHGAQPRGAPADSLRRGGRAVKACPKTNNRFASERSRADREMATFLWGRVLSTPPRNKVTTPSCGSTSLGLSRHGARYPERCMRLGARAAPALGVKNKRDDRVGHGEQARGAPADSLRRGGRAVKACPISSSPGGFTPPGGTGREGPSQDEQ